MSALKWHGISGLLHCFTPPSGYADGQRSLCGAWEWSGVAGQLPPWPRCPVCAAVEADESVKHLFLGSAEGPDGAGLALDRHWGDDEDWMETEPW